MYQGNLVLEGGAVAFDGQGTVLTAEECLLHRNRNPGWTRADIEAELRAHLGITKVIWLALPMPQKFSDCDLSGDFSHGASSSASWYPTHHSTSVVRPRQMTWVPGGSPRVLWICPPMRAMVSTAVARVSVGDSVFGLRMP